MVHWYNLHAAMLYEDGRVAESLSESRRGLDLAEKLGTPTERGNGCLQVAFSLPVDARVECLALLEKAARIARENRLDEVRSDVLAQRTLFVIQCGEDLRDAFRKADEGIESARRAGNVEREVWWRGVGFPYLFIRLGQVSEAREAATGGGRFRELHTGDRGVESIAYLSWTSVIEGADGQAEDLIQQGLGMLKTRGSWYWEIVIRLALARLKLRQQQYDRAKEQLELCRTLAVRSGPTALQTLWYVETLSLLIRRSLAAGDLREAEADRKVLLELVQRFGTELGWAFAWRAEGECLVAEGSDRRAAVPLFERSLGVWEKLGWGYEVAFTLAAVADLYADRPGAETARAAYHRALRMFQAMSAKPDVDRIRKRIARLRA
jgi:tetratricopeptide (TPR) repeat protein